MSSLMEAFRIAWSCPRCRVARVSVCKLEEGAEEGKEVGLIQVRI